MRFGVRQPHTVAPSHNSVKPFPFRVEAAVPEPSTWAMMILGFFGVGFMEPTVARMDTDYASHKHVRI